MSDQPTNVAEEIKPIAETPALHRVNYPVIQIKDRMIRVELDDADSNKIALKFQPYQALKVTTQDCYLEEEGDTGAGDRLLYQQTSAWLNELKAALHRNDQTANFMDKAVHFIIPAGDDVLEIAAWKIEITHLGKTTIFPEGVKPFPF